MPAEEVPQATPEAEVAFIPSTVEMVIHNSGLSVNKFQTPVGEMTILQFFTPAFTFTFKLDEGGRAAIVEALTGGIKLPAGGNLIIPR